MGSCRLYGVQSTAHQPTVSSRSVVPVRSGGVHGVAVVVTDVRADAGVLPQQCLFPGAIAGKVGGVTLMFPAGRLGGGGLLGDVDGQFRVADHMRGDLRGGCGCTMAS
jgi:hypothetical protein